jgi:HK97 family phage major capsid protein
MAYTNRLATYRSADDLSPREQFQYAENFWPALQAILSGNDAPHGLVREFGDSLRQTKGMGGSSPTTLTIPTDLACWAPTKVDVRARERWAQRAGMLVGTDAQGGFLRDVENIGFIELLRNRSVLFNMGARRMSGLVGNVTIPKQTAGATAYWLSTEATAITEADQTIGQISLTPRTVGAYTTISRLLQLQSSPDAQALIMNDLALQCALAVDLAGIAGTGTEQPTGILGTANVGTFSGTALAAAGVLDAQTDVGAANALTPNCGYVFTPATAALLMQRPELATTGITRLWQGNLLDGTMLGFRAMSSQQMPTGKGIFGDFSQVIVGEWGVLELAVNQAANFPAGITGLRCMYTVDVAVRVPAAFSITSSIT